MTKKPRPPTARTTAYPEVQQPPRHPTDLPGRHPIPNVRNPVISATRHEVFLRELATDGNVTRAASIAGCDRSGVYQYARAHPEFAERWAAALEVAGESLEAEAHRRAVEGVEEPIYYKGVECGRVRRYSDGLLALMLRARRPEYRETRRVEISKAPKESPVTQESRIAMARRIAFALQLGLRAAEAAREGKR